MSQMMPGRELDKIIAENVLGCKVDIKTIAGRKEYYCGCDDLKHEHSNEDPYLNYYSTDISAAWEVVEHLQTKFNLIRLDRNEIKKLWTVIISDDQMEKTSVEYGETVPHAICLAALMAVEKK